MFYPVYRIIILVFLSFFFKLAIVIVHRAAFLSNAMSTGGPTKKKKVSYIDILLFKKHSYKEIVFD